MMRDHGPVPAALAFPGWEKHAFRCIPDLKFTPDYWSLGERLRILVPKCPDQFQELLRTLYENHPNKGGKL